MYKELKESMKTVSHQIKTVNKEVDIIKKKKSRNPGVEKYNNPIKSILH